jgi:heme exporter protein C
MRTGNAKVGFLSKLAQPGHFLDWSRHIVVPLAVLCAGFFGIGLWYAFFNSPADYQMGNTVRIMYVHVPNAWLSQFSYGIMVIASIGSLVWRHPLADVAAKTAAPLGATFTAIMLITGAIWGRPTWGTYWVWDGRLTSALVQLFIYLGIIALWRAFEDPVRAARPIAIITLVGAINIPIIKFSVDWWSVLHQPASVIRADGPSMPASLLTPLLLMVGAYTLLFLVLHVVAMRTEITRRRIARLQSRAARNEAGVPA